MKVQRNHLRIAVVVLVAAVAYNIWVFTRPAARPGAGAPAQAPLIQQQAPLEPAANAVEMVDPLSIPAPPPLDAVTVPIFSRDPFLFGDESRTERPRQADVVSPDPIVRTILFSSTRRSALIDNKMVGVGDTVGSLKIVDIERTAVVFADARGTTRRVSTLSPQSSGITR